MVMHNGNKLSEMAVMKCHKKFLNCLKIILLCCILSVEWSAVFIFEWLNLDHNKWIDVESAIFKD